MSQDQRPKYIDLALFAALAAAVFLVYAHTLWAPFIFDDIHAIIENPSIVRLWPLSVPLHPPPESSISARPLVNLSLALNYRWGAVEPFGYHLVNTICHVLAAGLLFLLTRRILCLPRFGARFGGVARPLAFAVALAWAVHPLLTESVIYTIQRTELMMGVCYLTVLTASLAYFEDRRNRWLVLAGAACLAGMGCKEVMVSAPLVVLVMERTLVADSIAAAMRRSWRLYASFLPGILLLAALVYGNPRSESAGFGLSVAPSVWWMTQARVLLTYVRLSLVPYPLTIHYAPKYIETIAGAAPYLLVIAAIGIATAVLLWRRSVIGWVLFAAAAILSPTLVIPIVTELAAERRMYLPLAGIVAILIVGGYELSRRLKIPKGATVAVYALVVAAAGAASFARGSDYREALTIWSEAVRVQPDDSFAHYGLGMELATLGRVKEATLEFEAAVRLKPDDFEAMTNLGAAYRTSGRLDDAIAQYRAALRVKPDMAQIHVNLGNALAVAGKKDEAIEAFRRAAQLRPDLWQAHYALAATLASTGQNEAAIAEFHETLRLVPERPDVLVNLAKAYLATGQREKGIAAANEALALARSRGQGDLARQIDAWISSLDQNLNR